MPQNHRELMPDARPEIAEGQPEEIGRAVMATVCEEVAPVGPTGLHKAPARRPHSSKAGFKLLAWSGRDDLLSEEAPDRDRRPNAMRLILTVSIAKENAPVFKERHDRAGDLLVAFGVLPGNSTTAQRQVDSSDPYAHADDCIGADRARREALRPRAAKSTERTPQDPAGWSVQGLARATRTAGRLRRFAMCGRLSHH